MALTINSTTVSYASQADFLLFVDSNLAGDLVADAGIRTDLSSTGSDPADPTLAMHLLRATGKIESACVKANLYTPTDLASLAAATPATASTALLKWMTCALTLLTLRSRRGNLEEPDLPYKKDVEGFLEEIASGEDVFGFAETQAAALPSTYSLTEQDYLNLNLMTNNTRFWGFVTPQSSDIPGGIIR